MSEHYVLKIFPFNNDKKCIVCVITGSDGGITWARKIALQFNANGIPACAFVYWHYKMLPKDLSCIPIESIEDMVSKLKKQGYKKIYLYGFSKGAEQALVASTYFSDIDGVIAVSPSCAVFEGFSTKGYSDHSAWTYRGQELPYIKAQVKNFNIAKMYLSQGGYAFLNNFTKAFEKGFSEENRIKIENANCPILLISSQDDSIWPSKKMGDILMQKLKTVSYPYSYQHIVYPKSSHILCPVKSVKLKIFPQERKYAKNCKLARKHAFEASVGWIKNHTN